MKRRNALAAALALCLAFALTGCSKDSIINGFNDFLHHASRYALPMKKILRESGRQARTPTPALTRRNTTTSAAPNTSSAGRGSSGKAGMS